MADKPVNRILIIEDDSDAAKLLKMRLSSQGYQVHTEEYGKTGLNYAADNPPDLVILDLKLPDMHGYEVCRKLRELYRAWEMPILMLTAVSETMDKLRGFATGADAYLVKPYKPDELLQTVSLLLEDE